MIIFWKIRIDTLYEENGSMKIPSPGEIPTRKIPTHQTPPWKTPTSRKLAPRKFSPGLLPPISLIAFLHLRLCLGKFSQTKRLQYFWNIELQDSLLSNINDNGNNNEIKKTRAGIFKSMIGNISGENFPEGIHQRGVWLVEIFWVRVFLIPKKIYAKNSQVHMHWHWTSWEKFSFSKPIASVFIPAPIIFVSYGVEIFPHPLIQLIGHVSALIRYIEM